MTAKTLAREWLSAAQASQITGRHRQTIYKALREYVRTKGKSGLCGSQPGPNRVWGIRRDDLAAWMHGQKPRRMRAA